MTGRWRPPFKAHVCRMPMVDRGAVRHGTFWVCDSCGCRWEFRGFLGAHDDLRMVRCDSVERGWLS